MTDVDLANAIIAAALIQSGEFKLSAFDSRGEPLRGQPARDRSEMQRLIEQADVLGDPDFNSYGSPALTALRKLTNAIRRSLHEPPASDLDTRP
jgi:hypothetical protein